MLYLGHQFYKIPKRMNSKITVAFFCFLDVVKIPQKELSMTLSEPGIMDRLRIIKGTVVNGITQPSSLYPKEGPLSRQIELLTR